MISQPAAVFGSLSALADPLRCRVLLLLEKRELSVAELVLALQLPQSSVSRHLKALAGEKLVNSREDGASNRYTMNNAELDPSVRKLWSVLRKQTEGLTAAREDARRLNTVLRDRRDRSRTYFSSAAGQWDKIRRELFGDRSHLHALLALLDPAAVVGDLGAGTGHISLVLAPHVRKVIAVDDSAAMLNAARKRLDGIRNIELRRGDLSALPLGDAELDVAILNLVLAYVAEPEAALREVHRVLKPGGRVLIVDMLPHDREDIAQEMGHFWRGFGSEEMREWCAAAGLADFVLHDIPADAEAKGPSLFSAVALKRKNRNSRAVTDRRSSGKGAKQ
jgi:ArsR family transcriptional regulator